MRGAGTARHREEPEPPPDGSAIAAELQRVIAATAAGITRMDRRDRDVAAIAGKLERLAGGCPDLALLADKLSARVALAVIERISLAAHNAEAREASELYAQTVAFNEHMRQAAIAEGRRLALAEMEAAARPPRARHAAAKRRLRVVGSITAGSAVAASVVAGGAVVASQDSASVRHWAASPAAVRLHADRPDTAVLVPQAPRPSPSSRPSVAAASAKPAPAVAPSLSPSYVPPQPAPVPSVAVPSLPPPALVVQPALDLGALFRGPLTVTAGPGSVSWTVTATDGITVSQDGAPVSGGTLAAGQELDLDVSAPTGHGVVHFWVGTDVFTVVVSSDAGGPALALPSGL